VITKLKILVVKLKKLFKYLNRYLIHVGTYLSFPLERIPYLIIANIFKSIVLIKKNNYNVDR